MLATTAAEFGRPCVSCRRRCFFTVEDGEHEFQVRATNPEGVVEEPPVALRVGRRARARHDRRRTRGSSPGRRAVTQERSRRSSSPARDNRVGAADVPVRARRHGVQLLHSPDRVLRPHARHARAARPRARRRGQLRPDAGALRVGRQAAAGHDHPLRPAGRDHREHERHVHVRGRHARLDLLVLARRRARRELQLAGETYTGPRRSASTCSPSSRRTRTAIWEEQWVEYEWRDRRRDAAAHDHRLRPRHREREPVGHVRVRADRSRPSGDVFFVCSLDGGDPARARRRSTIPRPGRRASTSSRSTRTHPTVPRHPTASRSSRSTSRSSVTTSGPSSTRRRPTRRSRTGRARRPPARTRTSASPRTRATATIECSLDFEGFGGCESPARSSRTCSPASTSCTSRAVDVPRTSTRPRRSYRWTVVRGRAEHAGREQRRASTLPIAGGAGDATLTSSRSASPARPRSTSSTAARRSTLPGYGGAAASSTSTRPPSTASPSALCLPYDPADYAEGPARLLEYDGSEWTDITLRNDSDRRPGLRRARGLRPLRARRTAPTMAPLATILDRARPPHRDEHARRSPSPSDVPGAMLQCSLDGLPFTLCESPVTYTQLETGEPQVRGPGDRARSASSPQMRAHALRVGGRARRSTRRRPTRGSSRARRASDGEPDRAVEFTGIDDQTIDLDLEFECLLDGVLLGSCSSDPGHAGRAGRALRGRGRGGRVRPAHGRRSARSTRWATSTRRRRSARGPTSTSTRPTRRSSSARRRRPRARSRCSSSSARTSTRARPSSTSSARSTAPTSRRAPRRTRSRASTIGPHVFQVRAVEPDRRRRLDARARTSGWSSRRSTPTRRTRSSSHAAGRVSGPDVIFGFQSNELRRGVRVLARRRAVRGLRVAVLELDRPDRRPAHARGARDRPLENVDPTPAQPHLDRRRRARDDRSPPARPRSAARASATFTFDSDQADVTFMCSVDGSLPDAVHLAVHRRAADRRTTHEFEVYAVN